MVLQLSKSSEIILSIAISKIGKTSGTPNADI